MVRLKHRYVVGQVLLLNGSAGDGSTSGREGDLHPRDIVGAVKEKLQLLYGDVGGGQYGAALALKYLDTTALIFVLRSSRDGETQTRFAMTAVDSIKSIPLSIRTLACCGSVRTTKTKLRELLCITEGAVDDDRRAEIFKEIADIDL